MMSVTPQLLPKELLSPCRPIAASGISEDLGSFYIPNCQSLTQVVEINRLAELTLHEGTTQCLTPTKRKAAKECFQQFDSDRSVLAESLKNLHVFSKENYTKWSQKELSTCPFCAKEVTVLVTCPLWESQLLRGSESFFPSQTYIKPQEVDSFIALVFLIDMAYYDTDPSDCKGEREKIISQFSSHDSTFTKEVLTFLASEREVVKSRESISLLKNSPQFHGLRRDIWEYLSNHKIPSDLYKPKEYSNYFLKNFIGTVHLQTLRNQCEENCKESIPEEDASHPQIKERRTSIDGGKWLPLRYFLLGSLFIGTAIYFGFKIFSTFIKSRFFFGADDL